MSWSVSASGKPAEVAEQVEKTLAGYTACTESEQDTMKAVKALADTLLKGGPADGTVQVVANGHAITKGEGKKATTQEGVYLQVVWA